MSRRRIAMQVTLIVTALLVGEIVVSQTTEDGCGPSNITGSSGTIQSPNYPDLHEDNQFCVWNIQSPKGTRIVARFEEQFDLEPSPSGCYDWISIRAGSTGDIRFCGTAPYPSFLSHGNTITVTFSSDGSVQRGGFSMNWTTVDANVAPDEIEITTFNNKGIITSPGYPGNYSQLLFQSWVIRSAQPDKFMLLEFGSLFDVGSSENSTSCPYDVLAVVTGIEAISWPIDDREVIKLCGNRKPKSLTLPSNEIRIEFHTYLNKVGAGFSLQYQTIDIPRCSGVHYLNGTSGSISSPLYPQSYLSDEHCIWHITVPEDKRIVVRFEERFEFPQDFFLGNCFGDYLQIFDGPSTESTQFQRNLCGFYAPRGFLASGNELTVVLHTDSSDNRAGFSMSWMTEDKCMAGEFRCTDGTCINEDLKCDGNVDCPNDKADEFVCGLGVEGEECGKQAIPPEFKWDARIVGGSVAVQGSWPWQVRIEDPYTCGGSLISSEWIMTAAHCVGRGNTTVYIGDYNRTDYDTVREQRKSVDRIIMHPYYDYIDPQGFVKGADIALLHLETPVEFTTWVKPICLPPEDSQPVAGELALITGWGQIDLDQFASPEIMRQVRTPVLFDEECDKVFSFEISKNIICAGYLTTGGASSCFGDSGGPVSQLVDGNWVVHGIVSFGVDCGMSREYPGAYTKVAAYIPWIMGVMESPPGGTTEREVIRQSSGTISTPGFGVFFYPSEITYQWYIIAPVNKRITVQFNETFGIEYGGDACIYDYLAVYDGGDTGATKYRHHKLCGQLAPPNFESSTNAIVAEFHADGLFGGAGFSFDWFTTDDCAPQEFRCSDRTCIDESKKCDSNFDCVSIKDEMECVLATQPDSKECGKATIAPEFPWHPLIVGGHDVVEGSWPWQILLYVDTGAGLRFTCGGSLISENWVLTAAHCVNEFDRYVVSIGDHDRQGESDHKKNISVLSVMGHPDFSVFDLSRGHDIALLFLNESVDFASRWTKPICMPEMDDSNPPTGATCVVTGWGATAPPRGSESPRILQQVPLTILNGTKCVDALNTALFVNLDRVPDTLICAGQKDNDRAESCWGDSGGPLQCLIDGVWRQYGIVSFGSGRCGTLSFYARVSYHSAWMNNTMNSKACRELEIQNGTSGVVELPNYRTSESCAWLLRGPRNTVLKIQFEYVDIGGLGLPCELFDSLTIYDGSSVAARPFLDGSICGDNITVRGFESSTNEVFVTFSSDDFDTDHKGFKFNWEAVEDCPSDNFRCWDGTCIVRGSVCDGLTDCDDSSDEIECVHPHGQCGRQDIPPEFTLPPRIVGGMNARRGSWPWQAAIISVINENLVCGGAIIGDRWVLTAATCDVSNTVVFVGETDSYVFYNSTPHSIERKHQHPEYVSYVTGYDIAILELTEPLEFNSYVQPICMPSATDPPQLNSGDECIVTGWGARLNFMESRHLRQLRIPIVAADSCVKILEGLGVTGVSSAFPQIAFCAGGGGIGTCLGDWGGPLICFRDHYWQQLGVVTFDEGCGQPSVPSFFTKVSAFRGWIDNVTGNGLPHPPHQLTTSAHQSTISAHQPTTSTVTQTALLSSQIIESTSQAESNRTDDQGEVSTNPSATTPPATDPPRVETTSASERVFSSHVLVVFGVLGYFLVIF